MALEQICHRFLWIVIGTMLGAVHPLDAADERSAASPASLSLDFSAPGQHGILDKSGRPVGLTHRLPWTGGGLPQRDPNLELDTDKGVLRLTTTRSDVNGQRGLVFGEYLGVPLAGLGFAAADDFTITTTFRHAPETANVDQYGLYVGANSRTNLRAGVLHIDGLGGSLLFAVSNDGGSDSGLVTAPGPAPGDDLTMTLRRRNGVYTLSVTNLTRQQTTELSPTPSGFLRGRDDLHAGIWGANTGNDAPKLLTIDDFKVSVVRSIPMERTPPADRLRVLFLGDRGHHQPRHRFDELAPALARRGIDLTYTESPDDLSRKVLSQYHGLLVYANIDAITPQQEDALIAFVEGGNGLIVLHCGSFCFRNSERYVDMVGGQFQTHGAQVFRPRIVDAQHAAMHGVNSFETWDETYVHSKLRSDNRVLMVRDHGAGVEPYTWVRQERLGRVFYTALGHDGRTWRQAGFHRLVEGGIRWATGTTHNLPPHTVSGEVHPAGAPPGSKYHSPPPLSPQDSMQRMHLPEGFRVELFAAEPLIRNPLAMTFDERGRVWVIDSQDYPNELNPEGVGRDVVKILKDSNGDGKADEAVIFADGLNIPTTLVFGGGGLIVNSGPHILLLRDTDGDDRADERKVLYTGVGTWDTHATANNFSYGPDNWIWGAVGYSGMNIAAGGRTHEMKMGFYRFRPDGSDFEVVTATSNNTWGLGFTATGDVLGSTANVQHSWFTAIPNRYFEKVKGWSGKGSAYNADHSRSHPILLPARQWDHAGGFTSAAGGTIYTAQQFPAPYANRAMLVCEPTIHLIHVNLLERRGSHVVSRDGYNLLASDDPWCAPVQAMVGPDGAVWFVDLYSYTVLHNKPDEPRERHGRGNAWLTAVRDLEHARIYRIAYGPGGDEQRGSLAGAPPQVLVAALRHENMFWRLTAQRLLVERGKGDVLPALRSLTADPGVDDAGMNVGAMHALWTMHGLGALDGSDEASLKAAAGALSHPSGGVRRAAVSVLPPTQQTLDLLIAKGLLQDADGSVRLAAFLAASEMPPSDRAGSVVFASLSRPANVADAWIPQAATSAGAQHSRGFLAAAIADAPAAPASSLVPQPHAHRQALAQAVRAVATHWSHDAPAQDAINLLGALPSADPMITSAVLEGIVSGWPQERSVDLDAEGKSSLRSIIAAIPSEEYDRLTILVDRWGHGDLMADAIQPQIAAMQQRIADESLSEPARVDAATRLIRVDDRAETIAAVLAHVSPQQPPALVGGLLEALAQSRQPQTGAALVGHWPRLSPASYRRAVQVLLRRSEWIGALLDGVEQGRINRGDLAAEQVQQLLLHGESGIAGRAKALLAGGASIDPDRQKIVERLMPLALQKGDAERGRRVFTTTCAQCHALGGTGGKIGPDLTGIGARPPEQLLVDIIDPNRSIEANYRLWVVSTTDGQTFSGRLESETQTTVTILDLTGQEHAVQRTAIAGMNAMPVSIMPVGFENLPAEDLAGLLELLSASKSK